jgi:hypothetical protein
LENNAIYFYFIWLCIIACFVRGKHLRTLHGMGDHILMHGHCYALEYLVRNKSVHFLDALNQVNEMTEDETWNIKRTNRRMSLID